MRAQFCTRTNSIRECDFYDNPLFAGHLRLERKPWLFMREDVWHLCLCSKPLKRPETVVARPWRDASEPDGWKWRVALSEDYCVDICWRQIEGVRPPLPAKECKLAREMVLYVPYGREPRPKDTRPTKYETTFYGRPVFWTLRE